VPEVPVDVARVRLAAFADELEQQARPSPEIGRPGPSAAGGDRDVRPGMHQGLEVARHEAVGVEEVLLDAEARVALFQIAGAVAFCPVAQDQVLRARRGTDRVGLDETEAQQGVPERRGREKASGDGESPQVGGADRRHHRARRGSYSSDPAARTGGRREYDLSREIKK
jgi:hypothetical protein